MLILAQVVLGIFASLIIALSAPLTDSREEEYTGRLLSKRDSINSCGRDDQTAIRTATAEAGSILYAAANRLRGLNEYILRDPLPDIRNESSPGLISTFRTYSSFIDKNLGVGDKDERQPGVERVQRLAMLAQQMADNLAKPQYQVYCNDDFLQLLDNKGKPKLGALWDARSLLKGEWLWISTKPFESKDKPKSFVMSWTPDGSDQEEDVIAIDAGTFKDKTWKYQEVDHGQNYTAMSEQEFKDKQWHIGAVLNNHLTSAMIQMFSVTDRVAEDLALEDRDCTDLNMGSFDDEWSCIAAGADNPDHSSKNSLHFKYLTVALFLGKNDWSTGWSRPLADAKLG